MKRHRMTLTTNEELKVGSTVRRNGRTWTVESRAERAGADRWEYLLAEKGSNS